MKRLDPSFQVLYSELSQRALDEVFTSEFSLDGRFVRQESGGRRYWYFDTARPHGNGKQRRYVGPVDDPEITRRVESFKDLKADYRTRRKLVSTLVRDGYLPRPEPFTGRIVEALAEAGFFRLRGVLVGAVAYQAYSGLLGIRLPEAMLQTSDADFAQFHAISAKVADETPPMIEVLKKVDPTFREIPHAADSRHSTAFVARSGYRVEFLTPNTGSAEHDDLPARMPALGGASAQPLRFLDFLIYEPTRAVLLHGPGVSVLVPTPERYAVHKLIVATRRQADRDGLAKSGKDRRQASYLIEALVELGMSVELTDAYAEAWRRGPAWREAISASLDQIGDDARNLLRKGLGEGSAKLKIDPASLGPVMQAP